MSDTTLTVTFGFNAAVEGVSPEPTEIDSGNSVSSGIIDRFLDVMWLRHRLSLATLRAYREDLISLDSWLLRLKGKTVANADTDDLREFFVQVEGTGQSQEYTPTLSCSKRFYGFLLDGGFRSDDPTESLFVRAPRLLRKNV